MWAPSWRVWVVFFHVCCLIFFFFVSSANGTVKANLKNVCTLSKRFRIIVIVVWLFQFYLYMDGRGSFEFKPITDETKEFGS